MCPSIEPDTPSSLLRDVCMLNEWRPRHAPSGLLGCAHSAIASGGPDARDAFALLGGIGDRRARELLELTLRGVDGNAIEYAAGGLSADQCRQYLPELRRAALDPAIEPKLGSGSL